jgi:hypothetical protein
MVSAHARAAIAFAACVIAAVTWFLATPSGAEVTTPVRIVAAEIDGHSLFRDSHADPIPLSDRPEVPISVTIENHSGAPVKIRYLRITGAMLGVRFVSYQTSTNRTLPVDGRVTIAGPADFFDIDRQANGYINSAMQVVDEKREVLASKGFVADVDGRPWSTEGIVLLLFVAFGVVGLIDIGFRIARRGLTANRFLRGVLFAATFASFALAFVLGVAMLRITILAPATWIPILLLTSAAGFALGYISPGPLDRRAHEASDDKVIDLVAAEAIARASGQHGPATAGSAAVSHQSGEHVAHESGEFAAQHESGQFDAQHDSGSFPAQHNSGPMEPVEDSAAAGPAD